MTRRRARREALELREDEPHPMALLAARREFGADPGENPLLRVDEPFEIVRIVHRSGPAMAPLCGLRYSKAARYRTEPMSSMTSFSPEAHRRLGVCGPRPHRCSLLSLSLFLALAQTSIAAAATSAPEVQRHVRSATFEVVVKKPQKDAVTYEKPLPLELIPFVERNDAYWPIGTAFAIAPNTFATAGHVMLATVGSQFGTPGIRDAEGKVYPVERVLKFDAHEDFAGLTVSGTT